MGLRNQIIRYGLVGVLNTAITVVVITAMTFGGFGALIANATGFGAGLLNSYIMNRTITFKSASTQKNLMPFLVSFGVCYALNFIAVYLMDAFSGQVILAQLVGILIYNIFFFMFMKIWVFVDVK